MILKLSKSSEMSHRSSGSEKHKKKQRIDLLTPEGQLKLRGEKGEALPPITRPRNSSTSMTGKIGMPSSPRHPVAALPPNYSVSKSDKSKEGWRTPSRRVAPGESHTASHNQWLEDPRHYSVKRSGSYDPQPTGSKHRRSSSISGMSSPVQEPSRHSPASDRRHIKAKPAESRHGGWTGSGSDVIAHRDLSKQGASRKEESTRKRPENPSALAQSALNCSAPPQCPLTQQETFKPSMSHGKTPQWFDGSPALSHRHDTKHLTSYLCNVNSNCNAGGHSPPPPIPRSSSNGENPQSYPFLPSSYERSSPLFEGLSGGGARHSKHKQYTANGSAANGIQTNSLYSPGGSIRSGTSSPHKSPSPPHLSPPHASPPLQSPSPFVVRVTSSRGGLCGLRNLGNTCFMNSILQCLSHTPGMAYLFLNQQRLKYCSKSMLKGELAKAYANLVSEMWSEEEGGAVSPHAFKSQIQKYARRFMGYEQQDCQEFLRFMLAGLHDDLNQPKQRPKSAKSFPSTQAEANYRWEKYLSHECSKISDLFMGQLQSTLVCLKCKSNSLTFDPFWDLSLPMPRAKGYTSGAIPLESCLDGFTAKEKLTGSEQAYCDKCDALCDSEKWFQLQRLPEILVLHLKRFSGLRFRSKLDTPVVVPLDLDLKCYCVNPSDESAKYCLYAMSNHSGTAYGGHYTALSRHVYSKKWYNFNDSHVTEACPPTPSNVYTTSQAYVLFYHKKA